MNLIELLDKTASDWPKRTALIEGDNAVSYPDLVVISATNGSVTKTDLHPNKVD
jgi:non-ribosomal peptide synthetase component E (peptide arylation enzyme)